MIAALLAASSVILALRPHGGLSRLPDTKGSTSGGPAERFGVTNSTTRTFVCVVAVLSVGALFAGYVGAIAGAVAGAALAWWVSRLEPASIRRERRAAERDLPLAIELWSACSLAGRTPHEALPVVCAAVGSELGARFRMVRARLELGGDPVVEWRRLSDDPLLGDLANAVLRSLESGAPLADGLDRLAIDCRRRQRMAGLARARSVGVQAAAPLALCFLPAFMLIGVVPTVAGSFQQLFH